MATIEELGQALVNADKAGDVQAARALAQAIDAQMNVAPAVVVTPEQPTNVPAGIARSVAGGLALDFADELEAAFRAGRISGPEYEAQVARIREQQKQFETEYPGVSLTGKIAGGLAFPGAALARTGARGMSLLPELATGAGLGAAAGYGASEQPYMGLEDALQGAAMGGLMTGAMAPITRAIAPRVRPEAQQLMREGVEVTPGGAFGGALQRAEQAIESVPVTGAAVTRARERGLESFDIAAVNKVLKNINPSLKVPKGTSPADAIKFADNAISQQYNKVVPQLKFDPQDINFRVSLVNSVKRHKSLPKQEFSEFQRQASMLVDDLTRATDPRDVQRIKSEFSRRSFDLTSSTDANQKALGRAMQDLNKTFFASLKNQNPKVADALKKADRAETDYIRVASAFARSTAGEVSTPAQLAQTIRQMSQSGGRVGFAEGRASPLQEFAQAGERVLGTKLPTSGTAERSMIGTALTGGGLTGLSYLSPEAGLMAGGAALASPFLYSQTMTKNILPFLLQERPNIVQQLGERARLAAPLATPSLLYLNEER
jgi:hypothetical protein